MTTSDGLLKIAYFKRFRMELELYDPPPAPALPPGYSVVPWDEALLDPHAEVLFYSFLDEIDARVFPSLGNRQGCTLLMTEIRRKSGFLPEATWLLATPDGYCGTVQAVSERTGIGAIQNIGITWSHRRKGLGSALLLHALHGMRRAGLGRALLEVTAQNDGAVRLYRQFGFRCRKTIYKAIELRGDA